MPAVGTFRHMRADRQYGESNAAAVQVDHAVLLYRRRKATLVDRRPAVRTLADALEPLRNAIKREMLSDDDPALFDLAQDNSFERLVYETLGYPSVVSGVAPATR